MCAGAITHARIRRLIYGAEDSKAGAVHSVFQVLNNARLNHNVDVTCGVLAARCMVYLGGGDPVRDTLPDTVPTFMQRFLRGCLLEGAAMRPDNAWKLLDELDELLLRLYGPPKFYDLEMT